jgi:transcriptional antiterminator NusG
VQKEAEWYIVHTYSGYENRVASNLEKIIKTRDLEHLIQEIFIPTQTVSEVKDNKTREVERKVFPGYVMIKMVLTDESWYVVRGIKGCIGFVSSSDKPIPLTDEEVKKFGMAKSESVEVSYDIGDSVQITGGPLEDFIGTVTELKKENNYVLVTVSMFGREVPVELELSQVQVMD